MSYKTPVAWVVTEEHEGHAVVVFHKNGLAARRIGSSQMDREFEETDVSRAKLFDDLLGKPITAQDYLDRFWWKECESCYKHISIDDEPIVDNENGNVFCNAECKRKHEETNERINYN